MFLPLAVVLSVSAQGEEPVTRINRFIELTEKKEPAFGIFAWNLSPRSGANIADTALDFVIIDLEHGPFDMTRLEGYLLGMVNKQELVEKRSLQQRVVPIVRIPAPGREPAQWMIKQVLDSGAMGVIVPHIETPEEALAAVQACRYPQRVGVADFHPEGKRGAAYRWAARYWGVSREDYARKADLWPLDPEGELTLWVMAESVKALENIEEIVNVPGIGGVFIGPGDLAFSMGVPPGDPAVEEASLKILKATQNAGLPCGTLTGVSGVEKCVKQGFRIIAVGFDDGLSADVERAISTGRETNAQIKAGTMVK